MVLARLQLGYAQGLRERSRCRTLFDYHDRFHCGHNSACPLPGPNELGGFILTTALGIAGAFRRNFYRANYRLVSARSGCGAHRRDRRAFLVLFIWNRFVATRAPAAADIRERGSPPRRWL